MNDHLEQWQPSDEDHLYKAFKDLHSTLLDNYTYAVEKKMAAKTIAMRKRDLDQLVKFNEMWKRFSDKQKEPLPTKDLSPTETSDFYKLRAKDKESARASSILNAQQKWHELW